MVENTSRVPLHRGDTWWNGLMDPLRQISSRVADFFSPEAEASAGADYYEIHVELPGVPREDIDVSVTGNSLTVTGEKKFEKVEESKTYYFSERTYGRFQRSFRLPADADGDKIYASHKDGVLTVKIGKRLPSETGGKKIEIGQG